MELKFASNLGPLVWTALGACLVFLLSIVLVRRRQSQPGSAGSGTHLSIFPPSRRHTLPQLIRDKQKPESSSAETEGIPLNVLISRALPTTRAAPLTQNDRFTPTGFSTQEIRALGRFPDYATLSGVRDPEPCGPGFGISRARFRPFRPFRWGYHQTMALMRLEPDYWLELEHNYISTMTARRELLQKHGDRILFDEPGSELACRELMEMILHFLCKRYPRHFRLESEDGSPGGTTHFVNDLLQTRTDVLATKPLDVVAAHVPEDFALMLRNEHDGMYYLRAALVCSSVGWDVAQHRNEPLRDIHGHVPDYASKLAFSVDRFFTKMPTDQPIQRCSWSLEDCAPLFSSPNAEKDWRRSAFADADLHKVTVDDVHLRCDWQTLRRLPLSGAVAFNFKAVFTPLSELRSEPFVPALLAQVLREGKPNLMDYKVLPHVRDISLKALERWAREQVEAGDVPEGWEVRTLDEHPFYPGWEERWHAEQGF